MKRDFRPFKNRTVVTKERATRQRKNCAAITKEERPRQRRICAAIGKDKAPHLGGSANDNFLITVLFFGSFSLLVTVLFVVERG